LIKAIIFDFFGVVGLSTYAMMAEKYNFTTKQLNESWDLHRALDAGFINQTEFLQAYADIIGITNAEMVASFKEVESKMGYNQLVLKVVNDLKKDYKVGLLTNVSENAYHFVKPIVKHFDKVVASYMVHIAKPDVAIFELMAQKFSVDVSECIMIDDSELNCQGAISAGMQAIKYTSINQLNQELKNI
jgi:epoxide hydrolase-like predicted phosphatase